MGDLLLRRLTNLAIWPLLGLALFGLGCGPVELDATTATRVGERLAAPTPPAPSSERAQPDVILRPRSSGATNGGPISTPNGAIAEESGAGGTSTPQKPSVGDARDDQQETAQSDTFRAIPNPSDMIAASREFLGRVYRPESLDSMNALLGGLLVPSYLPSGFTPDTSWNDSNGVLYLKYMRDGLRLSVAQANHDAWPFMKRGYAQPVAVGGRPGLLVRGGYVEAMGAPRVEDTIAWWRDNSKMWLVFQSGSRWVSLRTYGGLAPLPDDELIRVAESLALYEGGQGSR